MKSFALLSVVLATFLHAAPPGDKDVIANLWSWNWNSVARECTGHLGPAGYGGVQVAPPQDSLTRGGAVWWDVYQPARYTLTSKFGTESQFAAMVRACHDAGVKVYADAVINHMTGQGSTSYGGASFGKYSYPGLYSAADFHYYAEDCGNSDNLVHDGDYAGSARNVQNCELVGLSDLETEEEYVRGAIAGYLNKLIGLGVDGFRVDAAKHTSPGDLGNIYGRLTGSPYIYQEVIYGANEAVQPGQYTGIGDVLEFQYGRYLREKFNGSISDLRTFGESWGGMQPSAKSVTFVANHDTERGTSALSYKDGATYRLANIFQLAWNYGTPQVYDGFTWSDREAGPPHANGFVTDTVCGSGWECLHRDPAITGMVGFHNAVKGTGVGNWAAPNSGVIAFSRGAKGWIALNNGGGAYAGTFTTGLPAGTYANLTGTGTVTVNAAGQATVTVPAKGAVAITSTAAPGNNEATVYYRTSWSAPSIHYGVNGTWTTPPGVAMESACAGWFRKTVALGQATSFAVTFNNGSGTWDNNGGQNYTVGTGLSTVANGVVTGGAADPCAGSCQVTSNTGK
ncbi:alpha-amylase [Nonomuraea solani]|uniref:Alpha-amylase n=1 Tax=Nonomuraea solani TaxID=1144553 RepID=A0A1H6EG88_9ACTN|nr:carbohydrate binding domain-containing protein [Nonomuraea solani]SEG96792.1 alpha-amylase [Nonomuraea solani]